MMQNKVECHINELPNELFLSLYYISKRLEQARLAQVNKKLNELSKTPDLELAKYKSETKTHIFEDTMLVLKKAELYSCSGYTMFSIKNGKKVFNTGIRITDERYDFYVDALKKDTLSLINLLMQGGGTSYLNATVLQEALNKSNLLESNTQYLALINH